MLTNEKINFDKEIITLAAGVYKGNEKYIPKDWIKIREVDSNSGFHGEAFYKNKTIVISFRGTEIIDYKDIINDTQMAFNNLPDQYIDAQEFYKKIKLNFPNQKIVFTGHSLGGSLAQLMGYDTGNETVTFNAYGVGDLIDKENDKILNIRNYGNINDTIFNINLRNQLGQTYIIKKNIKADYAKHDNNHINYIGGLDLIGHHFLTTMGNLEDAVEYKSEDSLTNKTLVGNVNYNVNIRDIDKKRVITNEEIRQMSSDEYLKNEKFINQQLKLGNIMSKSQAEQELKAGNLIWVNSYIRNDGTTVCGYYRRK